MLNRRSRPERLTIPGARKVQPPQETPEVTVNLLTPDEVRKEVRFFRDAQLLDIGDDQIEVLNEIQRECQLAADRGANPFNVGIEEFDWAAIETDPVDPITNGVFVSAGVTLVFTLNKGRKLVEKEKLSFEAITGTADSRGRFGRIHPHSATASYMIQLHELVLATLAE